MKTTFNPVYDISVFYVSSLHRLSRFDRHGLIPNLLDGGWKARFNCRDAVWWWLYCIKIYAEAVPEGHTILSEPVIRLFPSDSQEEAGHEETTVKQPLQEVIHEALVKHYRVCKSSISVVMNYYIVVVGCRLHDVFWTRSTST